MSLATDVRTATEEHTVLSALAVLSGGTPIDKDQMTQREQFYIVSRALAAAINGDATPPRTPASER